MSFFSPPKPKRVVLPPAPKPIVIPPPLPPPAPQRKPEPALTLITDPQTQRQVEEGRKITPRVAQKPQTETDLRIAEEEEKRKRRRKTGRRSTIITGPLGVTLDGATGRKTLFGQ